MTATERQRRWRHRKRMECVVVGVDIPVLEGCSALIQRGYMRPPDAGDRIALQAAVQRLVDEELLGFEPEGAG